MHAIPLAAEARTNQGDEGIESLGLSGATLMQLWAIGVASISDLTTHTTDSLRTRLAALLNGSQGSQARIKQVLADVHTALSARHVSCEQAEKALETSVPEREQSEEERPQEVLDGGLEPPDHESLDAINEELPRLFKDDPLQPLYQEMKRYGLLSRDEQNRLGRLSHEENDLDARNTLVVHNLRLAVWVARKYLWSKLELADLVQEGATGLITAAEKYDYRQGFTFATYAHWWVRQAITRAIQDKGDVIRVPVHLQELMFKVRRATNEIAERTGRPPTAIEIATVVEEDLKKIKKVLRIARMTVVSLNEKVTTNDSKGDTGGLDEIGDIIADVTALHADHVVEAREELDAACGRLNSLTDALYEDDSISERNKDIFVQFYGLDGSLKKRTLEHVAEGYEMTRERVRQIIGVIWDKLQLSGVDMDHDSVVEELVRIRELEKLAGKRVSAK